MPADNVGAGGIEFADMAARLNGDRSNNSDSEGKRWKLRDADLTHSTDLSLGGIGTFILALGKARHRDQQYDNEDRCPEKAVSHPDLRKGSC
jgi:hypothetical protein